ncbi:MAG: glycosyltransferase family A protein [Woeseiaceae bacterium]|nr:glycosyltransferase family A protein [Woeseiaceae bacterium]
MNTPSVTVIVTTYKRATLAERAVRSVLKQTVPADEIIVVEDGSDTDLQERLQSLDSEQVTYLRHESNQGLAAARNTGLQAAKCELVAYLDDDDVWLETRLAAQLDRYREIPEAERPKLAAIQVGCRIVNPDGEQTGLSMPINEGPLADSIRKHGAATPSSSFLFRREVLADVGGFDTDLISGIDHDVWMKLAVAGYSSARVPEVHVVVTSDERHTMMSDTHRRVAGIAQYVDKWAPTYREWFGAKAGEVYARRYFIKVIGGLAGLKLARGRYRDGFYAMSQAFRRGGWYPNLIAYTIWRTFRTFVSYRFPGARTMKHALSRNTAQNHGG